MGSPLLTTTTQAICSHGGTVSIVSATTRVRTAGSPVVTMSDTFSVAGCTLNISGLPSPCTVVTYSTSAARVRAEGRPVLLGSSVGLGIGAGPQGPVTHVAVQSRVQGA